MSQGQGTSTIRTHTDATRYLCTGVYIDRAFRNTVIHKVHNDPTHRTAPAYGFDLVAVTHKAWRAWMLETALQASALVALVIALVLDGRAVVVAACSIGIIYLAWIGLRAAPGMLQLQFREMKERFLRQRGAAANHDARRERLRRLVLCGVGCAVLVAIAVAAARHGPAPFGQVATAAVLLAVLACISASAGAMRQVTLNRLCLGGPLRPAEPGGRLTVIDAQQMCQYVVYHRPPADSGGKQKPVPEWDTEPTPFVGSGTLVHRWLPPLNVQLLRPGEGSLSVREHQTLPFQAHELVRHLKETMEAAGDGPGRLRGLQIADRLYVDERKVTAERGFLQGRCRPEDIERIIDDPHHTAQHYLEIQLRPVAELVTTAFVRATIRGRSLSLDFAACALTRIPDEYHVLDNYGETGAGAVLRSALRGVYELPGFVGGLWRLAEFPWVLARATRARKDRTFAPRRKVMIGTRASIREEKAAAWEDSAIDHTAIYGDVKLIEQRLLKATEDFLESKDVDTSVLKKLAFNIISNGILNMGKLDITNAAVGTDPQVNINIGAGAADGGAQTPDGDRSVRAAEQTYSGIVTLPGTTTITGPTAAGYRPVINTTAESERPGDGAGGGGDSQALDPAGGGDSQARRRYLMGQCQESVPVGKPFSLLASIVLAAAPTSMELEPFDVPPEGQDVLLVMYAPGLQLLGDQQQTVHVPADRDSRPVRFELRADTPGPLTASITAWIGGTYLGELLVEITAERDRPPGPHREVLAEITTESIEGAVSLVVHYDPKQNAYRFEFRDEDYPCEVTSNLAYDPGPRVERLVAGLDEIAKGRSGYSPAQTRDYLVNAGAGLWGQLVPEALREQFWDRQHRIRQLTILADKDTLPWELLYPMDPGHDAGFLVEQFPVTRAIFGWRLARTLRLQPARFVLPEGSLPEARDEIDAMRRLLDPGQSPSETISALTPLTDLIGSGNFGLLHFACHNTYDPADGSSIKLGNVQFTPTLLTVAVIQKVLKHSAPIVFINACRSAGLAATYNRLDGWASKFLEAGAAAFIGSLWAVSDGAAREFAQEFYGQLRDGSSLGEAVKQARQVAAAQSDDPTWLAYTVYGDPRATVGQRP